MNVTFICYAFTRNNIRLQPWRYIIEISKEMVLYGYNVNIITDGYPNYPAKENISGIEVHHIQSLRSFTKNHILIKTIINLSPDVVLIELQPLSVHLIHTIKSIHVTVIAMWLNTPFTLSQIISNIGISEFIKSFPKLFLLIINALVPSFFVRALLKTKPITGIITTHNLNKEILMKKYGVRAERIFIVPPGVSKFDLLYSDIERITALRSTLQLTSNEYVILYLGAPSNLRGLDTVFQATSLLLKKIPRLKLIVLSRISKLKTNTEKNHNFCNNLKTSNNVFIISDFLPPSEIKEYIGISNVVVLPFKLTQADMPISILEVMSQGKVIISTNIDGIPELLDPQRGCLISPNCPQELAKTILSLYLNPPLAKYKSENARYFMEHYPSWSTVGCSFIEIIAYLKSVE